MVSVIASNIKNRREYRDLCDLFDRTDSSGDGRLSLAEFMAACNHCGVTITEEELAGFASIAKNGEVTVTRYHVEQKAISFSICVGHQDRLHSASKMHQHKPAETVFEYLAGKRPETEQSCQYGIQNI